MKPVIVCPGFHKGSGGPVKTIQAFRSALDADQLCFYPRSEVAKRPIAFHDVEVEHSLALPALKNFHFVWPAKKSKAMCENASIVSCHSLYHYHSLWVNRVSRKTGVPYWFVPHGVLDPWVMTYRKIRKRLFWKFGGKRFLREASTVIFSTNREKDKAAKNFDLPNTEVIPWPTSCVELSSKDYHRYRLREKLGIRPDARVLVYLGRLHTMKRPLETIQAVGANKREPLHLLIIGNEDDVTFADCQQAAADAGISARVHVVGPAYGDDKHHYLMAGDAYISLSWRENFNHTAAESLAAGLPAILSPGNDIQPEIEQARCSWAIPNNNVDCAAKIIKQFCETECLELTEMGRRGRDWVKENLNFDTFAKRICDLSVLYGRH